MITRIEIPGTPATQGSLTWFGRGQVAHPAKLVAWRAIAEPIIRRHARTTLRCPVEVSIVCLFNRPESHYGTGRNAGTVKPGAPPYPLLDIDKLARAALDMLQIGKFLGNDSLVWSLRATKFYTDQAPTTHLEITHE